MKMLHSTNKSPDHASGWLLAAMRAAAFLMIVAVGARLPARAGEGCPKAGSACRSATVSVADLDLSTTAGMQTAQHRVRATARRLCGKVVNPWSVSHQQQFADCVDATMASALKQLPAPALASNSTAR